mgnify:FL=1
MPAKVDTYLDLARETALGLAGSVGAWTAFLDTASRLYKYPFADQLMIHAQRPEATACASYEVWNGTMRRYVRHGAKGIALVDNSGDAPRLRYVFDIADTGTRRSSRPFSPWEINDGNLAEVQLGLKQDFGTNGEWLSSQLQDVARDLAEMYFDAHRHDIAGIIDGSLMAGYDEGELRDSFIKAAYASTAYALLSRCGYDPAAYFDEADFAFLSEWNTSEAVTALGTAVGENTQMVLRQIERTIRSYERSQNHDRDNLHDRERRPTPEPESAGDGANRPLRETPPEVSAGAPAHPVEPDGTERDAVAAPARDRSGGAEPHRPDAAKAGGGSGRNGGTEGRRPDEVDRAYEQLQGPGRRSSSERIDLQLNLFDEAEDAQAPSAFSFPQEDADHTISDAEREQYEMQLVEALVNDGTYVNAVRNSDRQNAIDEGFAAIRRIAAESTDMRFQKLYHDNAEFRNGLRNDVLAAAYKEVSERTAVLQPREPTASAYGVGDFVWLDGREYTITDLQRGYVELLPPELTYPIYRTERRADFERLLRRDERNRHITDRLSAEHKYNEVKAENLDSLVTVQDGDIMRAYGDDAAEIAELLGLETTQDGDKKILAFPISKLSEYMEVLRKEHDVVISAPDGREQFLAADKPKASIADADIDAALARWNGDLSAKADISERIHDMTLDQLAAAYGHDPDEPVHIAVSGVESVVDLSWAEVRERVARLVDNDRFITKDELDKLREASSEHSADEPVQPEEAVPPDEAKPVVYIPVDGEWQGFPSVAAAEEAAFEEFRKETRRRARNFRITDEHLGEGGAKAKCRANIEAIQLLKYLERNGFQASPEQQDKLSGYVGWGGIPEVFDENKPDWSKEYAELKALLTPEEYEAARGSTLNAHYTSPAVIRAIYEAVGGMGFEGGRILEPSMGVGNFFGLLPENMANSQLYGVELDSITGRIAKQLYPEADITVAGFETANRPGFFDLAVGNVPFGQYQVHDPEYDRLGFSIHNYFAAKMIDQVRPGGIVAEKT